MSNVLCALAAVLGLLGTGRSRVQVDSPADSTAGNGQLTEAPDCSLTVLGKPARGWGEYHDHHDTVVVNLVGLTPAAARAHVKTVRTVAVHVHS